MFSLQCFAKFANFGGVVFIYLILILFGAVPRSFGTAPTPASDVVKLPFCGNEGKDFSRRLLLVSTLDGKLSALDLADGGTLKWTVPTSPGGLLSSSIHRLELTNNGQWVRMIPSLNGGLYKFDGETIEPIPVSADHLLSASFKFSDDLIISGGKETRSYGVSSRTGKVIYECSMNGCKNVTEAEVNKLDPSRTYKIKSEDDHDPLVDELIVIRRQTQTVRAIEPRTGGERWNFSVGHHELDVLKAENCHDRPYTELEKSLLDLQLKVIVPEGIVCAVEKENPNLILWQHQFDHPIVSAWKVSGDDKLENVDLFSYSHWPWSLDEMPDNYENLSPSLYVGMFKKQLYIQESRSLKKIIRTDIYGTDYIEGHAKSLRVPWKPWAATSSGLMLLKHDKSDQETANIKGHSVTALSVLYASEYVNGNGFFLYSTSDLNQTQQGHCERDNITIELMDEETFDFQYSMADTPVKVIIVSVWWWWKQIIVISLVTALILNIFLSRRMPSQREVVIVERHVEIKVPVVMPLQICDSSNEQQARRTNSESSHNSNFTSRFTTDFDLVQCLGKGGFGVVFEARNKLDDCNYAIKRIVLPNRQESRDRVLREVKTLAHCEHQHIVRYFQAWVETPPPGWQENEDKLWMDTDALSHSIDIPSPTELTPGPKKIINEVINKKNKDLDQWISNLHTNECINFDDSNRKTTFATDTMTDDDSFIQFKNSTSDDHKDDSVFSESHTEPSKHSCGILTNHHQTSDFNSDSFLRRDENSNSSFEIEFRNSIDDTFNKSKNNLANSNGNMKITNGTIDKHHIGSKGSSCFIDFNQGILDSNKRKSRTQSESRDHIISINTIYKNSVFDLVSENTDENKIPFKKTHKRPLSLDLSKAGIVNYLQPNKVFLYIQMQLCKKQSLKDWLKNTSLAARQKEIVPIFKQIVDAVEYVHLKGLIHRDLKPGNIFFSLDGQIKIGDFGLVTDMPGLTNTPSVNEKSPLRTKQTQKVGTYLYMSPEQLQGQQYNYKVDIYSLGFIFFELLVVFGTEMERIETLKALRLNKFPENFCVAFKDEFNLLQMMLSECPHERPTTTGIKARPPLGNCVGSEWDFDLPPRRRDSHFSKNSNS